MDELTSLEAQESMCDQRRVVVLAGKGDNRRNVIINAESAADAVAVPKQSSYAQ